MVRARERKSKGDRKGGCSKADGEGSQEHVVEKICQRSLQ